MTGLAMVNRATDVDGCVLHPTVLLQNLPSLALMDLSGSLGFYFYMFVVFETTGYTS